MKQNTLKKLYKWFHANFIDAWDDTKVDGSATATGQLTAAEWNAHVTDQKNRFNIAGDSTNISWDSTNHRLGIKNSSPTYELDVTGGISVSGAATLGVSAAHVLSFESPDSKYYIGDGTGYYFKFCKRISSVTTDLILIQDDGSVYFSNLSAAADGTPLVINASKEVLPAAYTQQVVTGSRLANGTVYQNTHSKPMYVTATIKSTATAYINIYSDSSNPPTTQIAANYLSTANSSQAVSFVVLPGNYYKVSVGSGTPTVDYWTEWY